MLTQVTTIKAAAMIRAATVRITLFFRFRRRCRCRCRRRGCSVEAAQTFSSYIDDSILTMQSAVGADTRHSMGVIPFGAVCQQAFGCVPLAVPGLRIQATCV
jgi:hypothetical protein